MSNETKVSKEKYDQGVLKDKKISGVIMTSDNEWVSTFRDMTIEEAYEDIKEGPAYDSGKEYILFETVGPSITL